MEDLRKEQIMIQNIYSKIFDEKLIRWFETAKVVVLKSWNKVLSDYETIHEYSSDLFKSQLDKILDRINNMNYISIEFLQLLNRLRQYFLDSWFHKLRSNAYSLSSDYDSFCEKFDSIELCLESFVITAQELMKTSADVRLERIYNLEGRIPVKRMSILDNVDPSNPLDTSFIAQGFSPRLASPRIENSLNRNKEKEYFTFAKKPNSFETVNSSRIRVHKIVQMTWTECKQYLESILSDEFVFISRVTEYIKEKLFSSMTLPFSTCGALRHLMNPYYSSLHNQILGENRKNYQQRNANINASSFSNHSNSFTKKESEDDVDSIKDIFKLDCDRVNSATSDDLHDFNSTLNQIEDMKVGFIQMGETSFPFLEEKNVDSLSIFYIEYLNSRITMIINGENTHTNPSGEIEPFTITKVGEVVAKPIHHCVHECIRLSRRQTYKENLSSTIEERKDNTPQCNTTLFRYLYNKEKDISTKQSLNDLRRSLGKVDDKSCLQQYSNNTSLIEWIISYRFEINSVFEITLNFIHSKTLELKLPKEKKLEVILLSSDTFVLMELVNHFVQVLRGDTLLTEYGFQSSLDTVGNHTITSNNMLFALKSILNGMKREVGKLLELYLNKISLEVTSLLDGFLQENEGWFGQYYSQSQPPNKKNKRRIVPVKVEKKSILNETYSSILNGLSHFSGHYITEDVRGFIVEYCCKLLVNQYISFIEKNHEENVNYLTRKLKRTAERVRAVNRLTMSLIDQLSEDKLTVVKSLDRIPNISIDTSLRDAILRNINHLISIQTMMIESENSVGRKKLVKKNQVLPGKEKIK
ncbi:predicted protein [Naegleria gruberi]|uniref:Predicted protein n=1 Tax=Naegleria gruberi TaxID=5762 RepID=D2UXN3_NAEGR|nr:uncharacterized protein NAEGRDRAFT_44983 [Naegleria gruberi]EFC50664.1 predicted protein [Naegleria gruberi]|eukprot:XP_002683408.1 predicted protein [Naegleria gruberi strain NEG-M]